VMMNLITDQSIPYCKIWKFTISSAFSPLLWSRKGPARLRRFIWKLVCEVLFTNEMRVIPMTAAWSAKLIQNHSYMRSTTALMLLRFGLLLQNFGQVIFTNYSGKNGYYRIYRLRIGVLPLWLSWIAFGKLELM